MCVCDVIQNAVEFEQLEGRILLASQQMAEAQESDSLLLGTNNSTPKMGGLGISEDTMDIDVEGMDTLLEDLRTSPQHSSDDSLGSDSDDVMSTIGTPSSLPAMPTTQLPSPSSSSSSGSSSSEEESELEDD